MVEKDNVEVNIVERGKHILPQEFDPFKIGIGGGSDQVDDALHEMTTAINGRVY